MSQITDCGRSHTHLVNIPNVGDFRLGFDDYEVNRASGDGTIKIMSDRVLSSLEPGYWTFQITLINLSVATYLSLVSSARASIESFLATGKGNIKVSFNGQDKYCYPVKVEPSKSYFDYDGNEWVEEVRLSLVDPKNTFF
jgi:hypothetical protein